MPTSPSDHVRDVLVVGAGPAGLAAVTRAASHGARVALVDAGPAPGGQYWRQPDSSRAAGDESVDCGATGLGPESLGHFHHDLAAYRELVELLHRQRQEGRIDYRPRHHVWAIDRDDDRFRVHAVDHGSEQERSVTLTGARLILATGAYDRQVPFPGWDLPGVVTAGGAQALLKGHGVRVGRRVVVAGTGPFLLPVAAGLATAGATVAGVHEAASPRAWLRHAAPVGRNLTKLGEGFGYARTLARHRVSVRSRSVLVAAHGAERLESVTVARSDGRGGTVPGSEQRVACDALAVGWGFTPQLELPLALRCAHRVDVDGSVVCVTDDDQQTTVAGVYVAGETCGVGGAALALVEGVIAGAAAAGVPVVAAKVRRRRNALRSFATAMHRAHPVPSGWPSRLDADTVVCRCEEVTAGRLHDAVDELGVTDARSAKLLTRTGMGWCQGRVCGYATACLTSTWTGTAYSPGVVGTRPIASPVTLGALAEDSSGWSPAP